MHRFGLADCRTHVQAADTLSSAVAAYKRRMNACGHRVWHWHELASDATGSSGTATATPDTQPVTNPVPPPSGSTLQSQSSIDGSSPTSVSGAGNAARDAQGRRDEESGPASDGGSSGAEAGSSSRRRAGAGDYYYGSSGASHMLGGNQSLASGGGGAGSLYIAPELRGSADTASLEGFIGLCTEAFNVTDREEFGAAAAAWGAAGEEAAAQGTSAVDASRWGCGHVVLAVGPERGWTAAELRLLQRRGFAAAAMGARVLSSPTAVVAAVSVVQEVLR